MKGLAVLEVECYGKVLVGRCYRSGEDGGPGSPGDDGAVTIRTEGLDKISRQINRNNLLTVVE